METSRTTNTDNLSIFELRHIAGELGIKYPSKFKRDALIEEIKAVKSGKKNVPPKSKRGRPHKPLTTIAPDKRKIEEALKYIDETVETLKALSSSLREMLN